MRYERKWSSKGADFALQELRFALPKQLVLVSKVCYFEQQSMLL